MCITIGFLIVLMIILFIYMLVRYYMKRSPLTLICLCGQSFILSIALLCFVHRINIIGINIVELSYILLGIIIPACFVLMDYKLMISDLTTKDDYFGLIKKCHNKSDPDDKTNYCRTAPEINIKSICDEKPVREILDELKITDEYVFKNTKRQLLRAQLYINVKDYKRAHSIYESLTTIINNCASLLYNHGNLCFRVGKYNDALKQYEKVLELNKKYGEMTFSNRHKRNPDTDGTLKSMKLNEYKVYFNMGNALFHMKRFYKASEKYKKSLILKPNFADAIWNIERCYESLDNNKLHAKLF